MEYKVLLKIKNLICTDINHGQGVGQLRLFFDEWSLNIEGYWEFKDENGKVLFSKKSIKTRQDKIPPLQGKKIVDIKINNLGERKLFIYFIFEDKSLIELKSDSQKYEAGQVRFKNKDLLIFGPSDNITEF